MTFWWWDDALTFARQLAKDTHIRHKVKRAGEVWVVEPVLEVVYGVGR